jgi:hypothetical protein
VSLRVADGVAQGWQPLTARLAVEADERTRRNLEVVARHIETEYLGEIDEVMTTMVAEPVYEYFGAGDVAGPRGYEAAKHAYESDLRRGNRHVFRLRRVAADHGAVMLEGTMLMASDGAALRGTGIADDSGLQAGVRYLMQAPMLVVLPVSEDGLIEGERVYFGGRSRVTGPLGPPESGYLGPIEPVVTAGGRS